MSYKIGVVGVGKIVKNRALPELTTLKDFEVTCIYDTDAEQLSHIKDIFNIPKSVSTVDEFFNQPLDAIYVATPHCAHEEYVVRALEKGISVIVEKPCADNLKSAEKMLEASRKSKSVAMVAYMSKWNRTNQRVLELIGKNRIGKLLTMTASFGFFRPLKEKDWRTYRKDGGPGVLADLGIYIITTALDFFGETPVACQANGFPTRGSIFGEKFISGKVDFTKSRWLLLEASWVNPTTKHCYTLLGDKGVIHIEGSWAQNGVGDITICTQEEGTQKIFEREINPYREEFNCLKKCLDGSPVPHWMSIERAVQDIKVMDALERSAAEMGKEIKII